MENSNLLYGITVLMPTFNHEKRIAQAIRSLQLQTYSHWELIVINDGSPDNTAGILAHFLEDKRIRYYENDVNQGLGYCLNLGLSLASFKLIAYLPSDDIFYKDHLESLYGLLMDSKSAAGAYSKARSEYYDWLDLDSPNNPITRSLQLVQILHWKTDDVWMERGEFVTDCLEKMFFDKLRNRGELLLNDHETCQWIDHTEQRSRIISENFFGGIYKYKLYYNVSSPLRFQSTFGNYIDEFKQFEKFRLPSKFNEREGLRILIVGELAYNPERIYILEQNGHKLYGLWLSEPSCFNTIGPLPFGNVENVPYDNWQETVNKIKPDIIYGLLNMQTIDLAHEVLMADHKIPFIWHFKEGPFFCLNTKLWNKFYDLYEYCDGRIFINQETCDWFGQFLLTHRPTYILDGDLPKSDWFDKERSPLLSERDGEVHTVLAGRPMGFKIEYIRFLAQQKIHLHFYGDLFQSLFNSDLDKIKLMNNPYFHIHPNCDQGEWVQEFSKYDAGWLHLFDSKNFGEILRADWNDLNYPARLATMASAGLPMIQKNNCEHIVATQTLTKKLDMGVFFNDIQELEEIFSDRNRLGVLRQNAWEARAFFQFDTHVDDLISFFRDVIKRNSYRS
jgi:glycosyltransferase involved in cell wall biosynthesis